VTGTRIVLADDHGVVRAGLRLLLDAEPGFEVVAEAADVDGALRAVLGHKPDVLVLDLNMPGGRSSLEALPDVAQRSPATRTVILTMQEDPEYARRALRAGALGYVLKDAADGELVDAIRSVAEGGTYLNPALGARLATTPEQPSGPPGALSGREAQVLRLIALGYTNAEIAEQLFLSVRTVLSAARHRPRERASRAPSSLAARGRDPGMIGVGVREARGVRRALPDVIADRAEVLAQVGDEIAAMLPAGVARRAIEPAGVKDEPASRQGVLVGPPGVLAHRLLEVHLRQRIGLVATELASEDEANGHGL